MTTKHHPDRVGFSLLASCLACSMLLHTTQATGQEVRPAFDSTHTLMRAKLSYSQEVLHGLLTEDFARIESNAKEMQKMSKAALWPRSTDPIYRYLNDSFRQQCQKLSELAEARNQEGAHYAYLSITTSCIHCHNYVRGRYKLPGDSSIRSGPVQLIPAD